MILLLRHNHNNNNNKLGSVSFHNSLFCDHNLTKKLFPNHFQHQYSSFFWNIDKKFYHNKNPLMNNVLLNETNSTTTSISSSGNIKADLINEHDLISFNDLRYE